MSEAVIHDSVTAAKASLMPRSRVLALRPNANRSPATERPQKILEIKASASWEPSLRAHTRGHSMNSETMAAIRASTLKRTLILTFT